MNAAGRVWVGHNIQRFDCPRIREAFADIGQPPPEPTGVIDSLPLLTQGFGRRAGDLKVYITTVLDTLPLGQTIQLVGRDSARVWLKHELNFPAQNLNKLRSTRLCLARYSSNIYIKKIYYLNSRPTQM